jgi:ATP-dependent Lhr-like helicase
LIQLYGEERFIEPPRIKKMPLSLAFHQTLSVLASSGELQPKQLASIILNLPPLSQLSRETYRELLLSMVQTDYLELTEEKG